MGTGVCPRSTVLGVTFQEMCAPQTLVGRCPLIHAWPAPHHGVGMHPAPALACLLLPPLQSSLMDAALQWHHCTAGGSASGSTWVCLQVFGCRKKMSAIAVLDFSGAEQLYAQMQQLAAQGRAEWLQHHGLEVGTTSCSRWRAAACSSSEGRSLPLCRLADGSTGSVCYLFLFD